MSPVSTTRNVHQTSADGQVLRRCIQKISAGRLHARYTGSMPFSLAGIVSVVYTVYCTIVIQMPHLNFLSSLLAHLVPHFTLDLTDRAGATIYERCIHHCHTCACIQHLERLLTVRDSTSRENDLVLLRRCWR